MKKVSFYIRNEKWKALEKELKKNEKDRKEWFQEIFDAALEKYLEKTKVVFF